jgi:predicted Zn-dependent protease
MYIIKSLSILILVLILLAFIPTVIFGQDTPDTDDEQSGTNTTSAISGDQNRTNTTPDTGTREHNPLTTNPPDVSENVTAEPSMAGVYKTAGPGDTDIQKAYSGWYRQGVNASEAGNFQAASEAFAAALRLKKGSEEAQTGYAAALSKLGRNAEALEIYSRVYNVSPANTSILIPLGRELNAAGRHPEALTTLLNATNRYPDNPDGWNQLAAAYAGMHRYEEALATVRRSLQISWKQAGGWGELGVILSGQGRFYEAIAAFEKSLTLDPEDITIWKRLGDTWTALSRYDEAIIAYKAAIDIRPADHALWVSLGDLYEKQGDMTLAAEAYGKGGKTNQTEPVFSRAEDQEPAPGITGEGQPEKTDGNTTDKTDLTR